MCIWRHLDGFFMQYFTKGWLRSACFSAMLFFALNITGCGTSADATAVAGTDYSATSGTLQFAPGEVRKFIPVSVLNNPA